MLRLFCLRAAMRVEGSDEEDDDSMPFPFVKPSEIS